MHECRERVAPARPRVLGRPLEDVVRRRGEGLGRLRTAGTPYRVLDASPVDPPEFAWLTERAPQARSVVRPVGHHRPHPADPTRFAALLADVGAVSAGRSPGEPTSSRRGR